MTPDKLAPCMVHAALCQGEVVLWGEWLTPPHNAPRLRGRLSVKTPRPHPFELGDAFASPTLAMALGLELHEHRLIDTWAWLPTWGNSPGSSCHDPSSKATPRLHPWAVAGLPLLDDEVLSLLERVRSHTTLAPGVHISPTLAALAYLLDILGLLLTMGRFVPTIRHEATQQAHWAPADPLQVPAALVALAHHSPPALCALTTHPGDPVPKDRRRVELDAVFTRLLDAELLATGYLLIAPPSVRARKDERAQERWVRGFYERGTTLEPADAAHLGRELARWRRPVVLATRTPVRLSIELEEPLDDLSAHDSPNQAMQWPLRVMIQDRADASLRLDVTHLEQLPLSREERELAAEYILEELGRARHHSSVLAGLKGLPRTLDTSQAWQFLHADAAQLDAAGISVRLPAWWTGKGTRKRLRARARVLEEEAPSQGFGLHAIVSFQWQVALGDLLVDEAELRRLAALKVPLLRLDGQWVEVDAHDIERALKLLEEGTIHAQARELAMLALGSPAARLDPGLEVEEVHATGAMGEVLAGLGAGEFTLLEEPEGFVGELRPYQRRGFSWLHFLAQWGFGACLADDMGLGKTVQTLTLLMSLWRERGPAPSLLVCPTSVIENWRREAARFVPELPVLIYHGPGREALRPQFAEHALILTSYGVLPRDVDELEKTPWRAVILDEAQQIKNPSTRRARAARKLPAELPVALTGTPVENRVGDLWSIMEFLNPGLLGDRKTFKKHIEVPIQLEGDEAAAARLRRQIEPFVLRRLKTDADVISDLPDKIEQTVPCTLTPEQASLYQAELDYLDERLAEADPKARRGVILGALTRLKQVCNHPRQRLADEGPIVGRSGKLQALDERIEAILDVGEACLIFSQYKTMGQMLVEHLEAQFECEVLFLNGSTPRQSRDAMVERFNEAHGPPTFVLSLLAGGTGLNLVRANHVVHYDRWWNPAVENQATDRSFRIGQTRHVHVHKFVCQGTLEERIDQMLERKRTVADQIVGAGEQWLTELDDQALREALALGAHNVNKEDQP